MNIEIIKDKLQQKNLAVAVLVLVLMLLLVSVCQIVNGFVQVNSRANVSIPLITCSAHVLPDIGAWHLFGDYESAKLPETDLQLSLQGVFAASDQKQAASLIAGTDNVAKSYRVGDTLPGGVLLKQILSDKVILEHNGKLETLRLIRPKLSNAN